MPTAAAKQDMQDYWFIRDLTKKIYLRQQAELIESGDGRKTKSDRATMTFEQFCAEHSGEATELANQCREVMWALGELHFDVVLAGQWLPRQTIIVSEPFSSQEPIQTPAYRQPPRRR